jgi:tRNA_anti-like
MKRIIFLAFFVFSSAALAQSQSVIQSTDIYAEFTTNPQAANAQYVGQRVNIIGAVVSPIMNIDSGAGHIRTIYLAGDQSKSLAQSVMVCFTESCSSTRFPTIPDEAFKKIKVGSFVSVTCTVESPSLNSNLYHPAALLSNCALLSIR